jgi:hypothetical protein
VHDGHSEDIRPMKRRPREKSNETGKDPVGKHLPEDIHPPKSLTVMTFCMGFDFSTSKYIFGGNLTHHVQWKESSRNHTGV